MKNQAPAVWFPAIRSGSGADVYTQRLADALQKRGIRAEIAWLPLRAEYAPWSVAVPKPPGWATVAHINSWLPPCFVPITLPVMAVVHGCVHDPALAPFKRLTQALYHRMRVKAFEAKNIRNASVVVAVSSYTAQQTRTVFGRADIHVIHNWVDGSQFHPEPRRQPHKPFRLLFAGNWNHRKGVDLLAPILRCLGPDFVLRFPVKSRDSLPPNLPPNMHPIDWTNDTMEMARLYSMSDALLFPSRLEGLSLTVLEAQSCGLPVIASDASSLPEVVDHGNTGLLCPVDDVDAFVAAVRSLARNNHKWRDMAEAARRRAVERFAEQAAVDRYVELYGKLVQKAGRLGAQASS